MPYIYKSTKDERRASDAINATQHLRTLHDVEMETYLQQVALSLKTFPSTDEPKLAEMPGVVGLSALGVGAFDPFNQGSSAEHYIYAGFFGRPASLVAFFDPISSPSERTASYGVVPHQSKLFLLNDIERALGEAVRDRLDELDGYASEDTAIETLDTESMRAFLSFMLEYQVGEIPELYSTQTGNIIAEWRKNKDNKLVIEFLNKEQLKFVVFYRDTSLPGNVNRYTGINSASSFLTNVAAPQVKAFLGLA